MSVVVPVHNAMPGLSGCLDSVLRQRLAGDIEIIAVDDASTDSGPALLEELESAHTQLRVITLAEHSRSPGRAYNQGMGAARGEYVFFLNGTDRLGDDALSTMVSMARRSDSDIVLGKISPMTPDASHSSRVWARSRERAGLADSDIYDRLDAHKLFRRDLLRTVGERFDETESPGWSFPVTVSAYLEARAVSIVADRDCYLISHRPPPPKPHAPAEFIARLDELAGLVAARVSGPPRNRLLERHVRQDILRDTVMHCWLDDRSDTAQAAFTAAAQNFLKRWMSAEVFSALPPVYRVMAYCLSHDRLDELTDLIRYREFGGHTWRAVVDDGRVYAGLPFFRNLAVEIPDECYDMTAQLRPWHRLEQVDWHEGRIRLRGHAFVPHVDTDNQLVTVLLREHGTGRELRVAASGGETPGLSETVHDGRYDYEHAGFEAAIDPTTVAGGGSLPEGGWDLWLEVTAHGVTTRCRIRAGSLDLSAVGTRAAPRLLVFPRRGAMLMTAQVAGDGQLSLRLGGSGIAVENLIRLVHCDRGGGKLTIAASGNLRGWPTGVAAELCLARGKVTKTIPAAIETQPEGLGLTASVPRLSLTRFPGWWGMGVRLSWHDGSWEAPVRDHGGEQVWLRGRRTVTEMLARTRRQVRA